VAQSIGITSFTLEDDAFVSAAAVMARARIEPSLLRSFLTGEEIRDWSSSPASVALFPYDRDFRVVELTEFPSSYRFQWPYRTNLSSNKMFGKKTKVEAGLRWWEYGRLTASKLRDPLSITFAFVATHNHFVLDRSGKVFNRSAPVIKLPAGSAEDNHLGLLGLLNSSVACFWMKQIFHNKGSTVDQHGARQRTDAFEDFYEYTGTGLNDFPLSNERPLDLARKLDTLATTFAATLPGALLGAGIDDAALPNRAVLDAARARAASLRKQMIASQEELDWHCYGLYGVLPPGNVAADVERATPPEIALGERAFEIALARRMDAGREATTWFERHGSMPTTEVPSRWPEEYREVVQRRIDLIEHDRNIGLIERPEYKRRWNTPAWEDLERAALSDWLLDRLEAPHLWPADADHPPQLTTVNRLADAVRIDTSFMQIAELYAGHSGFDVTQVVSELISGESVPFLPVLRYSDTGLRKRAQWEDTWALQRREDAGENVGKLPVPPKYQSKDFLKADLWRLRGGLDVPKERWVSYPGCERGADTSLPMAWAGWNHLQQATALAAYYLEMKENEGWEPVRLQPLLAGLLELVPWLEQWHNEIDTAYGERMGTYYRGFVNEEARALGLTLDDLRAWKSAVTVSKRGRKKAAQTS